MKDLHKMDQVDRMLSRLPSEDVAGDLAGRVNRYVRLKRRRRLAARFGLSLVLAACGFWLSSPLVTVLPDSVHLPGSGPAMAWAWGQAALSNLRIFLVSAWNGFTGLQSGVATPLSASICLGLVILAASALLAFSPLLQLSAGSLRKGV